MLSSFIEDFDLHNNEIVTIKLESYIHLNYLKFTYLGKEIDAIEPKAFASLKYLYKLDLSFNKMSKIVENTFADSSVSMLGLSSNQIEIIQSNPFIDLQNPLEINLINNRRTQIYDNTFSGTKTKN